MNTSPPIGASCPSFTVDIPVERSNPVLKHRFVIPQSDDQFFYFFNQSNNPDFGRCDGVSYQAYYETTCQNGTWSTPNYSASCND